MEKFKKTMKREDGFTLVELLAVIVILGIILAIAIPAIGNVISKAGEDADDAEKELILDAARLYFTLDETEAESVTPADLVEAGYLESKEGGTDWSEKDEPIVYLLENGSVSFTEPE